MATTTKPRARRTVVADVAEEAVPETVSLPRVISNGDVVFDEVPLESLPERVEVFCNFGAAMITLVPEIGYDHQITGRRIVDQPAVQLRFQNHRAWLDREHVPYLAESRFFNGKGAKACMFLAEDPRAATVARNETRVMTGAMTAPVSGDDQRHAPLRGWDNLTPAAIQEAIDAGQIADPLAALSFEFRPGGARRESVRMALWRAVEGPDAEIPVDPIEPNAAETVPADTRRV